MQLILGSQSWSRQQVLRSAGVVFDVQAADIDEKAIRSDDYQQLPLLIARAKADKLIKQLGQQEALLVTADTVVVYRNELREKPKSEEQARYYLKTYKPQDPAWVNTGMVVTDLATGHQVDGFGRAAVYFNEIPDEVIDKVIIEGLIFRCAGGFAMETPMLKPYVEHIEGEKSAVYGLPLTLFRRLCKAVAA